MPVHVTMKEIANKAKVSIAAVSQVLNNRPGSLISEASRQRILQIAKDLNYRPNSLARALVTKRTYTVGMVIPDAVFSLLGDLIRGVDEVASKNGYHVIICHSGHTSEKEGEYINLLLERRVDGLIVIPLENSRNTELYRELVDKKFPIVFAERYPTGMQANCVIIDWADAAYIAAKHLITLGHRRIAYMAMKARLSIYEGNLTGYKRALQENGIPFEKDLVVRCARAQTGEKRLGIGYQATKALLAQGTKFTALFTAGDNLAVGAIRAIKEHGLRVPDDIAVVGFDDSAMAPFIDPPLSTVTQHKYRIGGEATRLVLGMIKGDLQEVKQVVVPPKLVVRESCGSSPRRDMLEVQRS